MERSKGIYSAWDQSLDHSHSILSESYLIMNDLKKCNGKFGVYYKHLDFTLVRCWFLDGTLQIGRKDSPTAECLWIATIYTENDFKNIFKILTSTELDPARNSLELSGYSFEAGV